MASLRRSVTPRSSPTRSSSSRGSRAREARATLASGCSQPQRRCGSGTAARARRSTSATRSRRSPATDDVVAGSLDDLTYGLLGDIAVHDDALRGQVRLERDDAVQVLHGRTDRAHVVPAPECRDLQTSRSWKPSASAFVVVAPRSRPPLSARCPSASGTTEPGHQDDTTPVRAVRCCTSASRRPASHLRPVPPRP